MASEDLKKLNPEELKEKFKHFVSQVKEELGEDFVRNVGKLIERKTSYYAYAYIICILIVLVIFAFFGFKLYKLLTARERKREEKMKMKQQRRKLE